MSEGAERGGDASPGMPRGDLVLALLLAGVTVASRVPFRARLLPTWDAVQFALALSEYDVVKHQPHPPGYLLYVGAARALGLAVADPVERLTWLSMLASGAAVFLVYRLAWRIAGRATALIAATGLATSPLFWFYGTVPLPYAIEAALATLVATAVWPGRAGEARAAPVSAVVLGLAGAVRPSLLILLFPLWLVMTWLGLRRWRPVLGGCALIALTSAAWLAPTLWLAGGTERYLWASRELFDSTVRATTLVGSTGGWLANLRRMLEAGLMGLGLLALGLAWLVVRRASPPRRWGPVAWFLAIWIAPPLAYYVAVHFGQYGYVLTVLPACLIVTARELVRAATREPVAPRRDVMAAGVVGVALLHVVYFASARPVDVPEVGSGAPVLERSAAALRAVYRFRFWAHTAEGLREQEAVIAAYAGAIRTGFDPRDTVIVTELGNPRSYPWFRHATYYLPEFPVYHLRLGRFSSGYLSSRGLAAMAAVPGLEVALPPTARQVVWMVDFWNPTLPKPPGLRSERLPRGRWLYVLDVERPVAHGGYRLAPAATTAPAVAARGEG